MTLDEFVTLIANVPADNMAKLFIRFDLDSLDEAIERKRAGQRAAQQAVEAEIQALTVQREELRRQMLGL